MTRDAAYSHRLDQALAFVADAFRHTRRKGSGAPYLTHLLAVTALVGEHGGDEDQMVAALLHDYLEDIEGGSAEEIERLFGARVTGFVLALSDTTSRPKPAWRERKWRYVQELARETADLKLISSADKLHNARSVVNDQRRTGDAVFGRFNASRAQTLWYYRAVVAALGHGFDHAILDELRETVASMHELAAERLDDLTWPYPEPPANDV